MLTSQFERALPAKLMIGLLTGACDACTGIEQASGRSIDTGINHDPDAIGAHDTNTAPEDLPLSRGHSGDMPREATGG